MELRFEAVHKTCVPRVQLRQMVYVSTPLVAEIRRISFLRRSILHGSLILLPRSFFFNTLNNQDTLPHDFPANVEYN